MTLGVYAHVFNSSTSPSVFCRGQVARRGFYNPINLPRISFMSPERGRGGHAGSPEGKDSPQMSLFDRKDDDRP